MTTILEAAHELHGGDETPQPMDCSVCEADIDYFIRYGEGRPDFVDHDADATVETEGVK